MKYAIISDVHANLEALNRCFEELDRIKPDRIVCLGDIVDYGAQPNECIEIVKQKADVVLLGNHDEAQIDHSISRGFSSLALKSSILTRKFIKSEYIEWFRTLPRYVSENDILFVHSSPCEPEKYLYITCSAEAGYNFKYFKEKVCFIGHSHIPGIYEYYNHSAREVTELTKGKRYIINTGSTGQPRDNDPRTSFGIFEDTDYTYKNIRLEYDVKSAANKIKEAGLPDILGERLFSGQ